MNKLIKKIEKEYDEGNYEEVLKILKGFDDMDEYYKYASLMKISCFNRLKKREESLKIVNELISKYPYEHYLWTEKVRCHYFTGDSGGAGKALSELERITDSGNVDELLETAKLFNLICDEQKASQYCDKVLEIDENNKEALFEKSHLAIRLKDDKMLCDISNKLMEISDKNIFSLTPVFIMKIFSKDYRGAFEIVQKYLPEDMDDEMKTMFKYGLYNQMSEELNIQLVLTEEREISIDQALEAFLKYYEQDIMCDEIDDVYYLIV